MDQNLWMSEKKAT